MIMRDRANRLLMQFHITGRCNLSCRHCYRTEGNVEPLTFEDIIDITEQYKALRLRYNKLHNIGARGHVNITGGEPFIRDDIGDILNYYGENRQHFSFGILTNGSFIDDDIIHILKANSVSFVQLSIDGDEKTHDSLRAPGDYRRTFRTAAYLEKNGVKTYISFTANAKNCKYLPYVASECRKRHISKLWSDRLVPIGCGDELSDLAIGKDELNDYICYMKKARGNKLIRMLFSKTEVAMNRALQFLNSEGCMYSCSAGSSLITVDEFARVMPCRRMPIICGNLKDTTLEKIYFENPVFIDLREKRIPSSCESCIYAMWCRGGAKCQSYAVYGDYNKPDPACPYAGRCDV